VNINDKINNADRVLIMKYIFLKVNNKLQMIDTLLFIHCT